MQRGSNLVIAVLQYCTLGAMWAFSAAITLWVLQLVQVAHSLRDAVTLSAVITLIALPVFWTLAAILTYTFFGLRRARAAVGPTSAPGPPSSSN